jgi:hypothetical protein
MHEITNQRMPHLQANCTLAPRGKKERQKTTGFMKITIQDITEESQTPKQLIICNKVYNTY